MERRELRGGRRRSGEGRGLASTEEVAQVLLVQVGPEQPRVGVGGLLYGRTLGDGGTRVVVRGGGWGDLQSGWRIIIFPYERGDVESSKGFLFRRSAGGDQLPLLLLAGTLGWTGQICNEGRVLVRRGEGTEISR